MRVVRHLDRLVTPLSRSVVTLGNFDGVHLGHQAILRAAVDRARALNGRAVALTFEPHPVAVLAPERAPAIVQPLHDRLAALRDRGIAVTVVQRFTREFAALEPEDFVVRFLGEHLELVHVVVGHNVSFGRNRAGTADTLRALGARRGFAVDVVGPVTLGEHPVSSSRLRSELREGRMAGAAALLGRAYPLRGRVVMGDQRGRQLGFPTANLHPKPGLLLPPDGVYAVRLTVEGRHRIGVLNIGVRPTFGIRRRTVEVHVLDFEGDLYGGWLVVEFVERLRGEVRFSGPEPLRAAIASDISRARAVLGSDGGSGPSAA